MHLSTDIHNVNFRRSIAAPEPDGDDSPRWMRPCVAPGEPSGMNSAPDEGERKKHQHRCGHRRH
jgi:hypothetical protein